MAKKYNGFKGSGYNENKEKPLKTEVRKKNERSAKFLAQNMLEKFGMHPSEYYFK